VGIKPRRLRCFYFPTPHSSEIYSPFPINNSHNMPSLKNLVLFVAATATGITQALPTVELVDRQQHLIGWFAMCPGPLWGATCQVPSWTSKQCCQ
jgi:hypothetical protein